jgi:hypothetical protein
MGTKFPTAVADVSRQWFPNEQLMNLLSKYHVVKVEDSDFNHKLLWCLEHCQNKFRDLSDQNCRAWYFENEQDALMFAMKWGS